MNIITIYHVENNCLEFCFCPSGYTECEINAHACVKKCAISVKSVTINTFLTVSNNPEAQPKLFVALLVASYYNHACSLMFTIVNNTHHSY